MIKLDSQNEELVRGVIPNLARAETLRRPDDKEKTGKGSIFRRKSQKRSKSLGRDHWEDVVFGKFSWEEETNSTSCYNYVNLFAINGGTYNDER